MENYQKVPSTQEVACVFPSKLYLLLLILTFSKYFAHFIPVISAHKGAEVFLQAAGPQHIAIPTAGRGYLNSVLPQRQREGSASPTCEQGRHRGRVEFALTIPGGSEPLELKAAPHGTLNHAELHHLGNETFNFLVTLLHLFLQFPV